MIYVDDDTLRLEWDEKDHLVLSEWHGFFTSDKLRAALSRGLEVIEEYHAADWLADTSDAKVTSIEDQDYITNEWIPQAIEHGLKKMAYVIPTDVIAQMAITRIVNQTQGVEIGYYSDVTEARQWLVDNRV